MEEATIVNSRRSSVIRTGEQSAAGNDNAEGISGRETSVASLVKQCGINFFRYLRSMNLSDRSDILVLPSNNHYYYDGRELNSIKVLINLKKLNMIKHVDMFLNMLVRVMPPDAEFVGCFSDSGTSGKGKHYFGKYTKLFTRLIHLLDPGSDRIMDREDVASLLQRSGFRTVDMKEMHGITYFCCKSSGAHYN
jgi:hypothetical protein